MVWLRGLLCALILIVASPAAARPYDVDDLLRSEKFGNMLVSPDGRWLVFERLIAAENAVGFRFNSMDVQRSRLYRVDLAHPGPAQPLIPISAKVATAAYSFSPDGRYLAFGRLDGTAWRLGIVTMATGAVRWFDLAPDYNVFRPTLAWIDNHKLVTLAASDRALPWMLDLDSKPQRALSASWLEQQAGMTPTVMAVGSGASRSITPDHPPVSLVLVDAASDTSRTLTRGPFGALSVSADGHYAAVVGEGELIPARADQLLAGGTDQRRRRLTVVAIDDGHIWQPCPACDLTVAPPRWAPSGHRLVFLARTAGQDWAEGKIRLGDAARQRLIPLDIGSLEPVLGDYPMNFATVAIEWLGKEPLLFAHRHGGDLRADWYRVGQGRPTSLTGALTGPSPDLVRTRTGLLLARSGQEVWAVGRHGARRLAVERGPIQAIASSEANAAARSSELAVARPTGSTTEIRFPGMNHVRPVTIVGTGSVEPVASGAQGRPVVARETAVGGLARLIVQDGAKQPIVVATLNQGLAGVEIARPVALHYRLADGTAMTSWMYVPAQALGTRIPLIVMPYGGTTFDDSAPSRDGRGIDLGTSSVAAAVGHGYAVLLPSMPQLTAPAHGPADFAGQILPAVDAAIATGRIDPHRLGLWGHSLGAYNTAMTITETDRFAAALVANSIYDYGSGIGVFTPWTRIDPGNGQSILALAGLAETGRPALGATPWGRPGTYIANSPLYRADRIRTPLLIVAADQDVGPIGQGEMLFSALFRQDKDAELLSYWGESHVLMSPANIRDFYARAFRWFDGHFSAAVTPRPVAVGSSNCPADSGPTRPAPSAPPLPQGAARHNDRCA